MNESFVTVVGNLTAEPVLRHTKNGKPFVTLRIASTARRRDPGTGDYVDSGTNYVNVVAFNGLAANVEASFTRGQRVIVYGRLRVNQYLTKDNATATSVEVEAYNAGHDLTWGRSTFARPARLPGEAVSIDRLDEQQVQDAMYGPGAASAGMPPGHGSGRPGDHLSPAHDGTPPTDGPPRTDGPPPIDTGALVARDRDPRTDPSVAAAVG